MSRKRKSDDTILTVEQWAQKLESPDRSAALELHKMQRKLRDERRAKKDALKKLEAAEERASFALDIKDPPKAPKIKITKKFKNRKRRATPVMLASDWHVEEVVDPRTVNGLNEYNPKIAEARARRYATGASWLINHHANNYTIEDAVLWFGGDMITGYIHEEFLETNAMSPTEATMFAQRLSISTIECILAETPVKKLTVICSPGNHGRTSKRPKYATYTQNSFEWLMYHALAAHYDKDDRVDFIIADGLHTYVDIYDWTIRFHHGDFIRYYGGVGGLSVPLMKAIKNWDTVTHADLTCVGHFHQFKDFGNAIVNGSLVGYNAFALGIKAEFEHARQAFFLMDATRGKCHVTPIWVTEHGRMVAKVDKLAG